MNSTQVQQPRSGRQHDKIRDEFTRPSSQTESNTMSDTWEKLLSPVSRARAVAATIPGAHAPGFMLSPAPQAD
ncbi:MAG TPA: hypothetical protein DHU55_06430 [Blastocatellia bacterium]|nr:hypothetical protein [Blastocatellia bacterium]HAF22729.1 hypothetical protein [Blastocatellia bacterium]HCX29396.1 hypothetical protein [Blastocatellia bacterium]